MNTVFDQMLGRYDLTTSANKRNAMHEVMQQITLSALNRAGFFDKAAFYGDTCLRIFHSLQRFSEDMDFSLLNKDTGFNLDNYFEVITHEFKLYGREVLISKKNKITYTHIESAFLKDTTEILNIQFQTEQNIKIKIEVDKDPPMLFQTEYKLLLLPYSFMTRCFTLPCLFAGKMHALLFRNWKSRVKGRDWYDMEWYIRNNTPVDFLHLKERALQSGYSNEHEFTIEVCKALMKDKINNTNIQHVIDDVKPFLKNPSEIEIWSKDYFLQLTEMIKFQQ